VAVDADIGTDQADDFIQPDDDTPAPGDGDTLQREQRDGHPADSDAMAHIPAPARRSTLPLGLVVVSVLIVGLGCLAAWWGYQTLQARSADQQRAMFLAAGRQAAEDLTTIDYTAIDANIKRILDASTGSFYDEFRKNTQGFVDVVTNAKSKSEGSVTAAGIETISGDTARILISVSVKMTNTGAPEQQPRLWRMRITLQRGPNGTKVSNVGFVP
jgi:Mce-associated membrane protein